MPLKHLATTLRENLRGEEFINNAKEVDRSTILFLAYFFIKRLVGSQKDLNKLAGKLDEAIAAIDDERDENSLDLLYALKEAVNKLESLEQSKAVEIYVESLNALLETFNRSKFYAPFVEDKCVLLCLLSLDRSAAQDDLPKYLLSTLIEKSYELSKKFLLENSDEQQ